MNWSTYLTEVLGIKHLYGSENSETIKATAGNHQFWNEQGYTQLSSLSEKVSILFLHRLQSASIFETQSFDMFSKMAQAMKLSKDDFQIMETTLGFGEVVKELEQNDFKKALVWFEGQGVFKAQPGNFPVSVVASPVTMLEKPSLKKEAWETLKKVMLQIETPKSSK